MILTFLSAARSDPWLCDAVSFLGMLVPAWWFIKSMKELILRMTVITEKDLALQAILAGAVQARCEHCEREGKEECSQ